MMTMPRLIFVLLISIIANTYAAGDPAAGKEKSATCQGCHGTDGNSYAPNFPNLASQNATYLAKQIHNFQSGKRKNETMNAMAAGLSQQDINDITAYFSQQKIIPDTASTSAAGKKLYEGGNHYYHTPACASCHGPNGVGNGPGAIPALAGQKAEYVKKALHDFKSGARSNDRNAMMRNIASTMTDKEIDAVADYLAGMSRNTTTIPTTTSKK